MPTKYTSPYATSFNTAIKRGTPCNQVVWNISKKTNVPVAKVYESLFKAGHCNRQKFNGQWLYWANNATKTNATNWKNSQSNQWQWFVDWALASGFCTPKQLNNYKGTQQDFMNSCKKFFGKQFGATASTSTKKSLGRKTTTTGKRKSTSSGYKFPKARSTSRRFRSAA